MKQYIQNKDLEKNTGFSRVPIDAVVSVAPPKSLDLFQNGSIDFEIDRIKYRTIEFSLQKNKLYRILKE
jgi:hypothetical protein